MTHEEMLEEAALREKKNEEEAVAELEKTGIAYYGNTLILEEF